MKAMKDCGKGINAMSQEKRANVNEMSDVMKDLDIQIGTLYDVVQELSGRLSPVLLSSTPVIDDSKKNPPELLAPLAQEIHTLTARLLVIRSVLQDVLDRLVL